MITNDVVIAMTQDPKVVEGYREWLHSPMTQKMLEIGNALARPTALSEATGEAALLSYGFMQGTHALLDLFTNLEGYAKQLEQQKRIAMARPNYGAEKIMKENGYDSIN